MPPAPENNRPGTAAPAQGSAGTARGEFTFHSNGGREDANGFLRNAGGYFLQGWALDVNGNPPTNAADMTLVNLGQVTGTALRCGAAVAILNQAAVDRFFDIDRRLGVDLALESAFGEFRREGHAGFRVFQRARHFRDIGADR